MGRVLDAKLRRRPDEQGQQLTNRRWSECCYNTQSHVRDGMSFGLGSTTKLTHHYSMIATPSHGHGQTRVMGCCERAEEHQQSSLTTNRRQQHPITKNTRWNVDVGWGAQHSSPTATRAEEHNTAHSPLRMVEKHRQLLNSPRDDVMGWGAPGAHPP